MDIGSAKPTATELLETPHALVDIREPWETYSAAEFCDDAKKLIDKAKTAGRIPVLVGGTMMYFRSLIDGLADMPPADGTVRAQILSEAERLGWDHMHNELTRIDPEAAARIHPNDPQRLQRALEVYRLTGDTITSRQRDATVPVLDGPVVRTGLFPDDRKRLHDVIGERFDEMLATGLVDEVNAFNRCDRIHRDLPSQRAVGYRQVWDALCGDFPEESIAERGKAATRQLAKRQLTWMRSMQELVTFDPYTAPTAQIAGRVVQLIEDRLVDR